MTLLTETNKFNNENTMKIDLNPPKDIKMQKASSEIVSNMNNSDVFNLSNDSTVKMKGTLLSSFITNGDGKGSTTMKSATSDGMGSSLAYSATGITNNNATKKIPMEVIQSEEGDSSSKAGREDDFSSDEQDDIARYEEVDVKEVEMGSISRSSPEKKKQKGILSPEQIAQAHKERETEEVEYLIQ